MNCRLRWFWFAKFAWLLPWATALAQHLPLTVPERTDYRKTSRLRDVEQFFAELQKRSDRVQLVRLTTSFEGRPVWLVVLGDPPPNSACEALESGKLVVYVEADIHAGEVEGKEVLQMLARDILVGPLGHLLRNQILLFVPVLNPDGNEKISPAHRRNQVGPEGGVGVRTNGQGLDLNRDFVKLESPEIRAVVNLLNRWDPAVFVDIHTTNGSYHRHVVTYSLPHNPNADPAVVRYLRNHLMKWVSQQMENRYHSPIIPYGNFRNRAVPDSGWSTFGPEARYGTNYVGLRNRLSILVENYAYATFQQRVQGCYQFVRSLLEYTNNHASQIRKLLREVDSRTGESFAEKPFGVRFRARPLPEPISLRSYAFRVDTTQRGQVRVHKTDVPRTYHLKFYGDFVATDSVGLPQGYLIEPRFRRVARLLVRHGIPVFVLRDSLTVHVVRLHYQRVETPPLPFQGHWLLNVEGREDTATVTFEPGTFYVPLRHRLAPLAAWLLEPRSPDGLLVWNFFDRSLRTGEWSRKLGVYPVAKALQPVLAPAARLTIHQRLSDFGPAGSERAP